MGIFDFFRNNNSYSRHIKESIQDASQGVPHVNNNIYNKGANNSAQDARREKSHILKLLKSKIDHYGAENFHLDSNGYGLIRVRDNSWDRDSYIGIPEWEDIVREGLESSVDDINDWRKQLKMECFYKYLEKNLNEFKYVRIPNDMGIGYPGYYGPKYSRFLEDYIIKMCLFEYLLDTEGRRKDRISASRLPIILKRCSFVIDNYYEEVGIRAFSEIFAILRDCKNKNDFDDYFSTWKEYYINTTTTREENVTALLYAMNIDANEKDYIPPIYFPATFNINPFLTEIGMAMRDEILNECKAKIQEVFETEGINYVFYFSDVKKEYRESTSHSTSWTREIEELTDKRWPMDVYFTIELKKKLLKEFINKCENAVRQKQDLPEIGGGWLSESVLYQQLVAVFRGEKIEQHASPEFLGQQHYDIFFPDYKVAIEYQGEQHNKPVSIFGGEEGLKRTQERDEKKRRVSEQNNIFLLEVLPDYDLGDVVRAISQAIGKDYSVRYDMMRNDELAVDEIQRKKIENLKQYNYAKSRKKNVEEITYEHQKRFEMLRNQRDGTMRTEAPYYGCMISHYKYLNITKDDVMVIISQAINLISNEWLQRYRGLTYDKMMEMRDRRGYWDSYTVWEEGSNLLGRIAVFYEKNKEYKKAIDVLEYGFSIKLFQYRPKTVKKYSEKIEALRRRQDLQDV